MEEQLSSIDILHHKAEPCVSLEGELEGLGRVGSGERVEGQRRGGEWERGEERGGEKCEWVERGTRRGGEEWGQEGEGGGEGKEGRTRVQLR